jgi:hypothetical protein
MVRSEVRRKQWEMAGSIFSYLESGRTLTGGVHDIIRACDIDATGYAVAKFLERAESMGHSPFLIERSLDPGIPKRGLTYRIRLKYGR